MSFLTSTLNKHAWASVSSTLPNPSAAPGGQKFSPATTSGTWRPLGRMRRLGDETGPGEEVFRYGDRFAVKNKETGAYDDVDPRQFSMKSYTYKAPDGGYIGNRIVGTKTKGGITEPLYRDKGWLGRNLADRWNNTWNSAAEAASSQALKGRKWWHGFKSKYGFSTTVRDSSGKALNAPDWDKADRSRYAQFLDKSASYGLQSVLDTADGFLSKSASTNEGLVKKCDDILDRIYNENPDYWPYGLSRRMFEDSPASELHLILDKKANTPVGFVGWYELHQGLRKVGYYSIGVLPEHRNSGFAKEAVQKMVAARASGVDEVRAMVRKGNQPSTALAKALKIPVEII